MDNEAVARAAAARDGDPPGGLRAVAALRKLADQLERAQVRSARARAAGTGRIGEGHLFAALLASPDSGPLLGRLGRPDGPEAVQAEVREARRCGGLTAGEEQALAGLGIDLDGVVARCPGRGAAGRGGSRQRLRPAPAQPGVPVSPEAIAVLNAAQWQKAARGGRQATARHLLPGLLAQPRLLAGAFAARGITLTGVLQAMGAGGLQENRR